MAEKTNITVGLLGHSPSSDNFGVGALTASHIAILRRIAHELGMTMRVRILCSREPRAPYVGGADIEILPIRTRRFVAPRRGLYSAVRSCDVIFDITGGDSFADIYGLKRFLKTALPKAIVLLSGRPLVLSPQTIGPFQRWWTRWIATQLMRRAQAVVARDNLTTELLRQLDVGSHVRDATDVAFRLPYHPPASKDGDRVCVGINVSGLLFNGGYTRSNMFGLSVDYAKLARALVRGFSEQGECDVHLISHVISDWFEVEDDYRVSERLADEFPGVIVAPRFESPSEAKSYIAKMDFFCGSRMHACIAAFSAGVPVVPLAYSRKFEGVFGNLGYPIVADCRTESLDQIVTKVKEAFEGRQELKDVIASGLAEAERKLRVYEAIIHDCFLEIAQT